jgi:hypothetical protein
MSYVEGARPTHPAPANKPSYIVHRQRFILAVAPCHVLLGKVHVDESTIRLNDPILKASVDSQLTRLHRQHEARLADVGWTIEMALRQQSATQNAPLSCDQVVLGTQI